MIKKNKMFSAKSLLAATAAVFYTVAAAGQTRPQGQIESESVEIVRDREIKLSKQPRYIDPIPIIPKEKTASRPMQYRFTDRALQVAPPQVVPAVTQWPRQQNEQAWYNSEVKAGGGNYGRLYGEAHLNSRSDLAYRLSLLARHNSTATGPVDGRNSGSSTQLASLGGSYLYNNALRLSGQVQWDRQAFRYYGYQNAGPVPEAEAIRQRISHLQGGVSVGNARTDARIDYLLSTRLHGLTLLSGEGERDWVSSLQATLPVTGSLKLHLLADAQLSRFEAAASQVRNLFRVRPELLYTTGAFGLRAGVNFVQESDQRSRPAKASHLYPVAEISYRLQEQLQVLAGYEGDLQRNTLRSLLAENRWVDPAYLTLLNTEKARDLYLAAKGTLSGDFSYRLRAGYAGYRHFYMFENRMLQPDRFEVSYDSTAGRGLTGVGYAGAELGYSSQPFTASLRLDYQHYSLRQAAAAWHRPVFTARWNSQYHLGDKLLLGFDAYLYAGIRVRQPLTGAARTLPAIADLNLKGSYLVTEQISGFISVNNLLGQTYQRFQYYPQQGLNVLLGAAYQF